MALVASPTVIWRDIVRRAGVGILSGTLAGLVVGVGARLAMRIVALVIDQTPAFTPLGTLNILVTGTFVGVTPGILYALAGRRLPGPPLLRGLTFSALLFVVLGVYPLIILADATEPAIRPLWLRWAVFGALTLVYGLARGAAEPPVDRVLPAPRLDAGRRYLLYLVLAAWGLASTVAFLEGLVAAEFNLPVQ